MPIIDRRSKLTPANMRAADVAQRMTEHIGPMQQARMMSAFRVQGVQGILYSRLSSGLKCTCKAKNNEVSRLAPDGKAAPGAINRVLTGNSNFGVSDYNPTTPNEDFDDLDEVSTSPNDNLFQWMGNNSNKIGVNQLEDGPVAGDNGQYSPDLDDMFKGFDLSELGITDVSCPICFGTGFVGGYQSFRSFRKVLVPSEMATNSYLMLPSITLSPGTHTCSAVLPRGAYVIDSFRTMNEDRVTASKFYIDGQDVTGKNLLAYFDGLSHVIAIETSSQMTHFEIQAGLSREPIYFEFPKRSKSQDISLLEQTEPFQVIISPDVPNLQILDIIAESQTGKMLIVQNLNPWGTRNRQTLGWECQVRVTQPQELFRILPQRRHISGPKAAVPTIPSQAKPVSGFKF